MQLAVECSGNSFTKLMHLAVLHELHRMRVKRQLPIDSICPEKTVLLEKHGVEREGRFDFLVRAKNKTIGIEVLARPSQGKLKEKLPYANEVDEFVFVLPHSSLDFYRKRKTNGFKRMASKKFLSREFGDRKLRAWLLDLGSGTFTEKASFPKLFNVK